MAVRVHMVLVTRVVSSNSREYSSSGPVSPAFGKDRSRGLLPDLASSDLASLSSALVSARSALHLLSSLAIASKAPGFLFRLPVSSG